MTKAYSGMDGIAIYQTLAVKGKAVNDKDLFWDGWDSHIPNPCCQG